jgi:aminopeptidase
MSDHRLAKIAEILVDGPKVKKGDHVHIETSHLSSDLALEIYKKCLERGAHPKLKTGLPGASFLFYKHANNEQIKFLPAYEMKELKETDVIISIEAEHNTRELSNADHKKVALYSSSRQKLSDYIVNNIRWAICAYPCAALAQEADMSVHEYTDFVYDAMAIPASEILPKLKNLRKLMNNTHEVRLIGKNTDLRFSIKGMNAIAEYAEHNIPDGEVFTAPIKSSVEGQIQFSYPVIFAGVEVDEVTLHFKKGKVVKATAAKNEEFLNKMLDMDAGARYLGEFGMGMNHKITKFTKNMLFDEKLHGTIHLALGSAYAECCPTQKNLANLKSGLHWDMLKDFRNDSEGKILFDGKVVQKNGKFTVKL